eukprot:CAMPEP_0115518876 /NCGR_PEP_ID=MMETSP0271-20121206/78127_1 /TAXON_ID=71861 /ORGANISM="Scrippsiella trochoidea, Strain CCMP3099" /LENGTH=46 /DNA_ID= /DNA_START= /DNA_END= /DNA_ORIENTATION=
MGKSICSPLLALPMLHSGSDSLSGSSNFGVLLRMEPSDTSQEKGAG